MVKDAIPAFDGSRYFIHVILLICLNVDILIQYFVVNDWAVTLDKVFDFRNVECWVCLPLVGER